MGIFWDFSGQNTGMIRSTYTTLGPETTTGMCFLGRSGISDTSTTYKELRVHKRADPAATLAHKDEWNGMFSLS